jgi:hypothetical protein
LSTLIVAGGASCGNGPMVLSQMAAGRNDPSWDAQGACK